MKLIKVNKTMNDYVNYYCVFPDRYIKIQSRSIEGIKGKIKLPGKIKVYSKAEIIDTFDNKKQMKEWLQGYIKKQKINLPRLKRLRLANDKRLKKNETN